MCLKSSGSAQTSQGLNAITSPAARLGLGGCGSAWWNRTGPPRTPCPDTSGHNRAMRLQQPPLGHFFKMLSSLICLLGVAALARRFHMRCAGSH